MPAWRLRRRRRLRQFIVSCALGAVVGALALILSALTGYGIFLYLALAGVGGIAIVFGIALIVGLNLGRPMIMKMEGPEDAMRRMPFAGVCVLGFAAAVILVVVIGALLLG